LPPQTANKEEMNVLFDIQIKYPEKFKKLPFDKLSVLFEWKLFVEEKIDHLKDEINKEEAEGKGKCVVIDLTKKQIVAFKYKKSLNDRIVASFPPEVGQEMWSRVEQAIQEIGN
jgi:hypothetical protein